MNQAGSIAGHQDVGRPDVEVQQVMVVRVGQTAACLGNEVRGATRVKRPRCGEGFKGTAATQLGSDEDVVSLPHARIEHLDDIVVFGQRTEHAGLSRTHAGSVRPRISFTAQCRSRCNCRAWCTTPKKPRPSSSMSS